jgi:hypothetical protein
MNNKSFQKPIIKMTFKEEVRMRNFSSLSANEKMLHSSFEA